MTSRGRRDIDWSTTSAVLADRATTPLLLLDGKGRVWMLNTAFEELIGRRRTELLGRRWVDEVVPADEREATQRRIEKAVGSEGSRCDWPLLLADGTPATATVDLVSIGRDGHACLLATLVAVKRLSDDEHYGIVDLRYEISGTADDFGRILRARSVDKPFAAHELVGARCYQAIHRRQAPCASCPALAANGAARRTAVVVSGWDEAPFAVVTAAPVDGARVEMTARFIGASVASGLQRARLQALADAGGLSAREREVLNLLLLGRSYREIGRALGIGERTVKYHQTRILDKVGADSRLDLMRLLF